MARENKAKNKAMVIKTRQGLQDFIVFGIPIFEMSVFKKGITVKQLFILSRKA